MCSWSRPAVLLSMPHQKCSAVNVTTNLATCGLLELLCTYSKDDIRALLVTDPSKRMTIYQLMLTPLVTGEEPPKGVPIPGAVERLSSEEPDEVPEVFPVPKSVRFLKEGVKAPRLHSIQEEVSRAMDMMRLGNDPIFITMPQNNCNNSLLERRRRTQHLSIPRVHC